MSVVYKIIVLDSKAGDANDDIRLEDKAGILISQKSTISLQLPIIEGCKIRSVVILYVINKHIYPYELNVCRHFLSSCHPYLTLRSSNDL